MGEHRDEARGRWLMCVEAIFAEEMMKGEYGFLRVPLLLLQERRSRVHHTMSKFGLLSVPYLCFFMEDEAEGYVWEFSKLTFTSFGPFFSFFVCLSVHLICDK